MRCLTQWLTVLATAAVLLGFSVLQAREEEVPPPTTKTPAKTAEPPKDAGAAVQGVKLVLSPAPEAWYVVGDEIQVLAVLRNESDEDVTVLTVLGYKNAPYFCGDALMTDEGSRLAPPAMPVLEHRGPPRESWTVVKAHENLRLLVNLARFRVLEQGGTYTLWLSYAMNADLAKQHTYQAPTGKVWMGAVTSNTIKLTALSPDAYQQRMQKPGEGGGLVMSLKAKKKEYAIGEKLDLEAVLSNSGKQPIQLNWDAQHQIYRVEAEGKCVPLRNLHPAMQEAAVQPLNPGDSKSIALNMLRENLTSPLKGDVRYRVEAWVRQPLDAAEKNGGKPLEPVRAISPDAVITVSISREKVAELMAQGVQNLKAIDAANAQKRENRKKGIFRAVPVDRAALDTLIGCLPAIAPLLPEFEKDADAQVASLARDLSLALKLKALREARPRGGVGPFGTLLDAEGRLSFAPADQAAAAGFTQNMTDEKAYAKTFMRLRRCSWYVYLQVSNYLTLDEKTTMQRLNLVTSAMAEEADQAGESLWVESFELALPKGAKGYPYLKITSNTACSMIVAMEPGKDGQAVYYALPYPKPDPRPNYFVSWRPEEMPDAIAGIKTTGVKLEGNNALAKYLAGRTLRHEQAWIIPAPACTWQQVTEFNAALRAWNSACSVSIVLNPPTAQPAEKTSAPGEDF